MKLQKRLEIAGFRRQGGSPTYAPVPVKRHPETWLRDNVRIVLHSDINTVYIGIGFDGSYPPEVREEDMSDERLFCWLNEYCPLPTFDELLEKNYPDYVFNFEKIGYVERVNQNSVTILTDGYKIHSSMEDWEADILMDGFRKLFKSQPHGK